MLELKKTPHRRWNPLLGEWVLVSPHRNDRPWQGQIERVSRESKPQYDPSCYLCPGNNRAGGNKNPHYKSTFVFDNDFAALLPNTEPGERNKSDLFVAKAERGICRVMCLSPRHDLTLSNMKRDDIARVVDVWIEQYRELGEIAWTRYVQIFENRGEMMGASNPHPHCQIWANESIPNYPLTEQLRLIEFSRTHKNCMLCEYAKLEEADGQRIVCHNDSFAVIVPFWAVWPFEAIVISRVHFTGMHQFNENVRSDLADILKRITSRYDNLFGISFPYSMGFHQRPTDGEEHPEWHFHAHFYPPLLRSATIRKFMVGYEMLAGPQRDITPELAAERLGAASEETVG